MQSRQRTNAEVHLTGDQSSLWDSLLLRRSTGDEPQGTMGRQRTAGEARCLLPAFLCAHIFNEKETSGYEAVHGASLDLGIRGASLRERGWLTAKNICVGERWGNISCTRSEGILEFYNISNLAIIWTKTDTPFPSQTGILEALNLFPLQRAAVKY